MKYGIVTGLVVLFVASAAMAQGVPSQSKLNKLGLGSMEVVSDEAGQQVRGKAFFKVIGTWQAVAGEKATLAADGSISVDPANFVANDQNNGSFIVSSGMPLTNGSIDTLFTNPFNLQNTATATHQQDVLGAGGNVAFSEISSSTNSFSFSIFSPFAAVPTP